MTKKKWMSLAIILVCAVIVISIFSFVFKTQTGVDLPWWAYIVALVIYALIVYLVIILSARSKEQFAALLAREGFTVEKEYKWDKQSLCIDFTSKRIANTYISTKPIIQFGDIASFRIESYQVGKEQELPDDKRFLSLVLTVKKEGFEFEYLYIPMFEIAVDVADIPEKFTEISDELVEKYPELKDMYELQADVKKILEINEADGIHFNIQKD